MGELCEMMVSIIVPVYKVPYEKLKKCIESVLSQTDQDYELILVDDGSPDECPKICDNYAVSNERIKVVHQKNKGLSGARNGGVTISSGNYITFIDGDDFIDNNTIERIKPILVQNIDIVSSRHKAASAAEDIGEYPYESGKIYSTPDELYYLKEMLLNFKGNNHSSCGKFYRRAFLIEHNLEHNEKLKQGAEDIEFNFRAFSAASSIVNISEGFYNCVYNENSITRSFNEENEYLVLKCFESVLHNIDKNDSNLVEWFYNRLLYAIIARTISGFFNPTNSLLYSQQKQLYKKYLNHRLVQNALKEGTKKSMDVKRKLITFCIKHHYYYALKILGKLRHKQKAV